MKKLRERCSGSRRSALSVFLSCACAFVLVIALAGCSGGYSNTTLTGEVTEIDGASVTLQLGELTESDTSANEETESGTSNEGVTDDTSSTAPDETGTGAPGGDMPGGAGSEDSGGGAPDGTASGAPGGDMPGGEEGSGGTGAETPGEGARDDATSDKTSSDMPGDNTDNRATGSDDENTSEVMPLDNENTSSTNSGNDPYRETSNSTSSTFTSKDETVTFDLSGAAIFSEKLPAAQSLSISDIAVGDVLVVQVGDNNTVERVTIKSLGNDSTSTRSGNGENDMGSGGGAGVGPGGGGAGPGGGGEVTQGTAANTIDVDGTYKNEQYTSTGDDENALRVTGATVELDSITVDKSSGSSSSTESGDFYGANAALLVTDGAQATISDAAVTSSTQNGNGIFSYGTDTTVNVSDSTITTTSDNSGGLQTTGGATMIANNLTIETSGGSAAAIRSDRGGGTVVVDRGTYTSNGHNSPAIYSTADISVSNAALTATGSEALVIEGKNSIALENCEVEGNMSSTEGTSSDENVHNVMIYQSQSGDAEAGTSSFTMKGGTLTSNNGDMFYVTNTQCEIELSDVNIVNKDTDGYLFRVVGNSGNRGWGKAGSNGAEASLNVDNQTLEGDIVVDSVSSLDMTFANNSTLTGTINVVDNAEGGTAISDNAVITVEKGCTWDLTDDCTVTSLENNGTVNYNGHTITLADGTVLS